jgi:AcrR family transcriptional regulator
MNAPATVDRSSRGADTRQRIIEAALETVRVEGFADTTARAIARHGGFNQALIFYHFGSVEDLLAAAYGEASEKQVARYREAVAEVSSLADLVSIARRLHDEDMETGSVTVVTQLMAAAHDRQRGGELLDRFNEWIALVQEALGKTETGSPLASLVPVREAAYAIASMFLGIELLSRLDPSRSEADAVFSMMESMASLMDQFGPAVFPLVQDAVLPGGEP